MKKIKLYDYQQRMLEEIIRQLTTKKITRYRKKKGYEEGNSVIVQMPTGTGKTYMMASVVKWFLDIQSGDINIQAVFSVILSVCGRAKVSVLILWHVFRIGMP